MLRVRNDQPAQSALSPLLALRNAHVSMAMKLIMDCGCSHAPRKPERTHDAFDAAESERDGGDIDPDDLYEVLVRRSPTMGKRAGPSDAWDSLVLYDKPLLSDDGEEEDDDCDAGTELTYTDSWSTLCSQDSIVLNEADGGFETRDDVRISHPVPLEKKVSFSTVEIREYAITVGDNPSCRGPFPLQLDWEHAPSRVEDAVEYGEVGEPMSRRRKPRGQRRLRGRRRSFRLSADERLSRLVEMQGSQHVRLREVQFLLEKIIACITSGLQHHSYLDAPNFADLDDAAETFTVDRPRNLAGTAVLDKVL
jgi:hypothetical protein